MQKIYLNSNSIGNEGAKSISELIRKNSTLRNIGLGNNCIWDDGVKWIASAIKLNSSLEEIDLGSNSIGDEGAKWIIEAIKQNQTLQEIGWNTSIPNDDEILEENRLRKKRLYRKLICAFTGHRSGLIELRFEKMILKFLCYPILVVALESQS
jgi:Ran GTPase-activating protein (RanGAP) involved in mRNA processing and transport